VKAAVAEFAPERVAGRCGIPAETIRLLARELASAKRAAVYGRIGTCTQEYGTLCSWLIDVVNIVTGHFDEPGGDMFPKAAALQANSMGKGGSGKGIVTGRRKSRVSGVPELMGEFPMTCLAEEMETPGAGQVKALVSIAANPALSAPNGRRLSAALDKLDFMVSVDIYLNETTRHADVILPGLSPLEELHYDVAFSQISYRNAARFSAPVFAPPTGRPAEWQILLRLTAIIMGKTAQADLDQLDDELTEQDVRRVAGLMTGMVLKRVAPRRGPERLLDLGLRAGPYGDQFGLKPGGLNLDKLMAAPEGIDLGPLESRVPEVLRTPSGKIELAPPMLIADLSRAAADLDRPTPELVVIGRRQLHSNNSWMHNLPVLKKSQQARSGRCTVLVNPKDAARLGLQDGAMARIFVPAKSGGVARSVEAEIEITDEMMPGVISLPHGWGHDQPGTQMSIAASQPGANVNALLDENQRDPLSGNAVLSGVAVQMEPVARVIVHAQAGD